MRKVSAAGLSGLVGLLMLGTTAPAGAAGAKSPASPAGYLRAQAVYARLHAQAVARGLHPGAALPRPARSLARPGSFSTLANVEQISHDTLPPGPGVETDTQVEPDIAVDPNDPNDIVAVFQQGRYHTGASEDPGYATSLDGGATWVAGNLPHLTQAVGGPFERASDPAVAFGPDGSVYAVTLALNFDFHFRTSIQIQRSDDGGITFHDPVTVQLDKDPALFNDKEWVAVDTSPTSPHYGRVYVAWDQVTIANTQPAWLRYSDDRGAHWSPMINVSGSVNAISAYPLVQPGGNLTIAYLDVDTGNVDTQTSSDGGNTFAAPVTIDVCLAADPPDQRDGACLPGAAVDPVTGYLYVGWTDARFRSDGLDDAVVSRSIDGGARWSPITPINPDGSGSGLEHETLALGAYGHAVHATYLTRPYNPATRKFGNRLNLRYIVSTDDGVSFGGELVVGPQINLQWSARAGGKFLGDYMGVAASADAAHPVWCLSADPGTGATYHQTSWSATVVR